MKRIYIYFLTALFVVSFSPEIKGQDFILSQPYNNSTLIAPSFAGMTNGGRVALGYRNQWSGVNHFKTFNTYLAGFDYFLHDINSGVGILISNDVQGSGLIRNTQGALQYNYRVALNRKKLYFRPGLQIQFIQRTLDYDKFVFAENITVDGHIINNGTPFNRDIESYGKVDAAVSGLFYNEHFWAGFSIDHLIRNNVSFLNEESKIPLRYTITAGYNWIYESSGWRNPYDAVLTFSGLIQRQAEFNQMDVGITWTKWLMQAGLSYRGFVPVSTITSHDALILSLGLNMENFKVVYSYDISLSSLSDTSGGSHEISIQFFFNQKERSPMSFFCR